MDYDRISAISLQRALRWHPGGLAEWSAQDWSNAGFGEAGELSNAVKKLRRVEGSLVQAEGPKNLAEAKAKMAMEIGDTYLYPDLLLQSFGMSMGQIIDDAMTSGVVEQPPYKASIVRMSNRVGRICGQICGLTDELADIEFNACADREPRRGRAVIKAEIGERVASLVAHLEDLAIAIGTDLETCVVDTFNRVSIRENFPERL